MNEAKSFDGVVEKLVLKESGLPEEVFGIDRGGISMFTEKDGMEDHE